MRSQQFRLNFLLHFTVFLLGFTGILGRLITVPSDVLTWYRMIITAVSIAVVLIFSKTSIRLPFKDMAIIAGIGVVVALHWVTFFGSIKLANVSVALLCLSVTTFFVAIFEPIVFKSRISRLEIVLGIIIIGSLAMVLIGPLTNKEHDAAKTMDLPGGVLAGIISALLAGIFTIMNKKVAGRYNGFVLTFYEMSGGFIALSIYFALTGSKALLTPLVWQDWAWLLVLAIICTAFTFWAMLKILESVSAYKVVLAINMEPVYGFILAAIWFGENKVLGPWFYAGSLIIIASIFCYSYLKKQKRIIHHS